MLEVAHQFLHADLTADVEDVYVAGHDNPVQRGPGLFLRAGFDGVAQHVGDVGMLQPLHMVCAIQPFLHLLEYQLAFAGVVGVVLIRQERSTGVDALHGLFWNGAPHMERHENRSAKYIPVWQVRPPERTRFRLAIVGDGVLLVVYGRWLHVGILPARCNAGKTFFQAGAHFMTRAVARSLCSPLAACPA